LQETKDIDFSSRYRQHGIDISSSVRCLSDSVSIDAQLTHCAAVFPATFSLFRTGEAFVADRVSAASINSTALPPPLTLSDVQAPPAAATLGTSERRY